MFISHLFYHFTTLLAFELFWHIILGAVLEVYMTLVYSFSWEVEVIFVSFDIVCTCPHRIQQNRTLNNSAEVYLGHYTQVKHPTLAAFILTLHFMTYYTMLLDFKNLGESQNTFISYLLYLSIKGAIYLWFDIVITRAVRFWASGWF